jgi:hypothetical protein
VALIGHIHRGAQRRSLSLRFNERTANPAVVFSGPPVGLIGGFSAQQDYAARETKVGSGEHWPRRAGSRHRAGDHKIGRCAVVVRDFQRRRSLFQPTRAAFRINRPDSMFRRISWVSGLSILFMRRPRVVRQIRPKIPPNKPKPIRLDLPKPLLFK